MKGRHRVLHWARQLNYKAKNYRNMVAATKYKVHRDCLLVIPLYFSTLLFAMDSADESNAVILVCRKLHMEHEVFSQHWFLL